MPDVDDNDNVDLTNSNLLAAFGSPFAISRGPDYLCIGSSLDGEAGFVVYVQNPYAIALPVVIDFARPSWGGGGRGNRIALNLQPLEVGLVDVMVPLDELQKIRVRVGSQRSSEPRTRSHGGGGIDWLSSAGETLLLPLGGKLGVAWKQRGGNVSNPHELQFPLKSKGIHSAALYRRMWAPPGAPETDLVVGKHPAEISYWPNRWGALAILIAAAAFAVKIYQGSGPDRDLADLAVPFVLTVFFVYLFTTVITNAFKVGVRTETALEPLLIEGDPPTVTLRRA